ISDIGMPCADKQENSRAMSWFPERASAGPCPKPPIGHFPPDATRRTRQGPLTDATDILLKTSQERAEPLPLQPSRRSHLAAEHTIAVFIAELILLLLVGRMLGEVMSRFGQPAIFGQLLAGVLLGPSIFGALLPQARHVIFPDTPALKSMI